MSPDYNTNRRGSADRGYHPKGQQPAQYEYYQSGPNMHVPQQPTATTYLHTPSRDPYDYQIPRGNYHTLTLTNK